MTQERNRGPGGGARIDQEGMALVLAIMVLLVLTVIGAALMLNVNTETKISGLKMRDTQALQVAEAGVQEAMLRLRNGDVPDDLNPRNVTIIFNQVAGSIPAVGTDTTALPTLQPAGSYLNYATSSKNPLTMLTMHYKTLGGVIQRYDDTANPKVNTSTGNPIWVIQSTGTQGASSRTVYAEVCRQKVTVLAKGAVVAQVGIAFKGNIKICGHDHRSDTPAQASPSAGIPLHCNGVYNNNPATTPGWWNGTVHSTCMPCAWSQSSISQNGSPTVQGEPSGVQQNMTGFYSGPWDVFNMTQSDF